MTNIYIDTLDTYCQQLFEFLVIRQSDIDLSRIAQLLRSKHQIRDLTETESKDWTRFTKEQLYEMRFFLKRTTMRYVCYMDADIT